MGKIFYIIGKSSTGKDSIYSRLMRQEELKLHKIVLYTTRPIRSGEVSGRQYFFVSPEELEAMQQAGKVIEARAYNTAHGIWNYFTADDGQIDLSKGNYLAIGTLESFMKIREYFGEEIVLPIYIDVEAGERLTRALTREKSEENPKYIEMCRRFIADEADFCEANIVKAGITKKFSNVELEFCTEEIINYIKSMQ